MIGGGDWATDRLVPDFFRATDTGHSVEIRQPDATRPWQHVLEPLSGYLALAEALLTQGMARAGPWNFGPRDEDARPVRWILDRLCSGVPGGGWQHVGGPQVHEAKHLKLDSSKANAELGWSPHWDIAEALNQTIRWHQAWREGRDMKALCLQQIAAHQRRHGE